VTNVAAQRPVGIKAGDRWSPELVEVIKRAAVEVLNPERASLWNSRGREHWHVIRAARGQAA
jgi:hypothetical protein